MAEPKPHILFVGLRWPPETFLARLVRGLLDQGHAVTIASPSMPSRDWLEQPGFSWIRAPNWEGSVFSRLLYLAYFLGRMILKSPSTVRTLFHRPYLRNLLLHLPVAIGDWDIIYFPWNSAAIRRLLLYELGKPILVSCRGSQINVAPHELSREIYLQKLPQSLQRAAAVHCVSAAIRQDTLSFDLDPAKSQIIRPAVDPDFFRPPTTKIDSDKLRLITIGSLVWVKGHEYLLIAIRSLLDKQIPVQLDIIGDGPERQRLQYTIKDLELEENVSLIGALRPEQVRDKLQQADVFLLSSLSEGISNAVLEAMACGLPVVSTDCGGMREAIHHGRDGFLVPVRDPATMAVNVQRLWEDPVLRRQLGEQARQRICAQFTLEQQAKAFSALFIAVAKGSQLGNKQSV